MYWADEIAEQVITKYPDVPVYTCASGISPSGVVHMGNLREVVTSWFVVKALRDKGKKVRFIFSWDNYDRFRKVPADEDKSLIASIGLPLDKVPDLSGCHISRAKHFEQPFIDALKELGIEVEHIFQAERYTRGDYVEGMITAIQKRKEIYDIIMSFKTQEASDIDRENYYPIEVYCSQCGKDDTKVLCASEDGAVLEYECKCGHKGTIDLRKEHHAKLIWKVDWPMRWKKEGVNFEPGGKDHSTEGGSAQVATVIVNKIFGGTAPVYRGYEFVGIKGMNGKMSSSKGNVLSPELMLKVYEPEIIMWMYTRFLPEKTIDISVDEEVLRVYHEFDRMYETYKSGQGDEVVNRIMEMALSGHKNDDYEHCPVSAQNIAAFAPIVNFDLDLLVDLLNKMGEKCTKEQIQNRFEKIKYWLENYSPESINKLLETKNTEFYSTLSEEEKSWVSRLAQEMESRDLTAEEMQSLLYDIPKINGEPDKTRQKRFFEIVYNLLLGKNKGPRLYLFLIAVNKDNILNLIKF